MELDRTFEEREHINGLVVAALDDAARNWGVKVLRYEIKDLTPPKEILHAMQAQITAEREKRAVIAASEGRRQEQINIATGQREAAIARSEGEKQAEINKAQGEAAAILAIAAANSTAIRQVAEAIASPGGMNAVNLKVAEQYVAAFANLAKQGNTLIVPSNMADLASLVTSATTVLRGSTPSPATQARTSGKQAPTWWTQPYASNSRIASRMLTASMTASRATSASRIAGTMRRPPCSCRTGFARGGGPSMPVSGGTATASWSINMR